MRVILVGSRLTQLIAAALVAGSASAATAAPVAPPPAPVAGILRPGGTADAIGSKPLSGGSRSGSLDRQPPPDSGRPAQSPTSPAAPSAATAVVERNRTRRVIAGIVFVLLVAWGWQVLWSEGTGKTGSRPRLSLYDAPPPSRSSSPSAPSHRPGSPPPLR